MPDLNFAQTMRLIWIDAALVIPGHLRRADICAAFAISVPQASSDLRVFQSAFPGRAVYDMRAKLYRPAPASKPIYSALDRQRVVDAVNSISFLLLDAANA